MDDAWMEGWMDRSMFGLSFGSWMDGWMADVADVS